MRKTTLAITIALALLPAAARAQASVTAGIQINLPVVLPPLVVVSPGVQVVEDFDREVFFTGGFYWVRHEGRWYRSPNHRGGWVLVPQPAVPVRLVKLPPGHYKRWKPAKAERRYEHAGQHERGYDDRRDDRRHDDRRHDDRRHDDRGRDDDRGEHGNGKHGKHGKH